MKDKVARLRAEVRRLRADSAELREERDLWQERAQMAVNALDEAQYQIVMTKRRLLGQPDPAEQMTEQSKRMAKILAHFEDGKSD